MRYQLICSGEVAADKMILGQQMNCCQFSVLPSSGKLN
ncbi:hypothetical protein MFFC18_46900 [Mariniblastus fucicola]|uniref:Uncharacterized protein n=1 Tax=Mariniblastus fucicola TaxID=980251 RepID=A0A5B9PDJ8_9BACT|nr:hypothetical protein MFFC18_46900 [Mariniblastus fucicola]